ncbi:MAG: UDP-N-acetylmuramoyl-tripeptide--D-alanyl-D-alanine ligase [Silvanigrellaceae bacterium]|nr:UDP-N-acetylmuramoyl-tripeptide--D-alanyl-D-alanine ligase [Silvanigrellaceae bacterium]
MWPLNIGEIAQILNISISNQLFTQNQIFAATTDSRKVQKNDLFIAIAGEQYDGHNFVAQALKQGACCALVSLPWLNQCSLNKNEKEMCLGVPDPLLAFREIAFFFRKRFSFPVMGIGGSNGKTTTKEMLNSLLLGGGYKVTKTDKSENGYLGLPITLMNKQHSVENYPHALILEIGIDEVGAMEKHIHLGSPDVVLLTALGPEHLNGLVDWETAAREEFLLFRKSPQAKKIWQLYDEKLYQFFLETFNENKLLLANDTIVFNKNIEQKICRDLNLKKVQDLLLSVERIFSWDIEQSRALGADLRFSSRDKWHLNKDPDHITLSLSLPGNHNCANFALACACALSLGRTWRELKQGWNNFVQPPMRSTVSEIKKGVFLYNDCYNASPLSMKVAIDALNTPEWQEKNKIVVLGDMLDLGSESNHWHESLSDYLKNLRNTNLFLYGQAMYNCYQKLTEQEKHLAHNNTTVAWFQPECDPSDFIDQTTAENFNDTVILVKGSRGMKLERLVKKLEGIFL